MFVHDSPDWADLLQIVAQSFDRDLGMVEKDYWVTHTLWAIHTQGFELWFKGGTSLSKGFGLIQRFSEDIDARIDAGRSGLSDPKLSWSNMKAGVTERDLWFGALSEALSVPSCAVTRDPAGSEPRMRSAWLTVHYPALHTHTLPEDMRPFVLLEVGRARVVPFVLRDLSSWVHDYLSQIDALGDFINNRPQAVRCIHPWVTCLEKLEAIARKFERGHPAADFVRHYEDAARILVAWENLAPPDLDLPTLLGALATDDNKTMPAASHPAFDVELGTPRWQELERAWVRIGPMFWGPRMDLPTACTIIRAFFARVAAS